MDEIAIENEILSKKPVEAFEWLLDHFRAHMRNQLPWFEVRKVFAQADVMLAKYRTEFVNNIDTEL